MILTEIYSQLFIAGIYHSACIYLFRVLELVPALATLPPLARTPAESSLRILYMAMYTSKIRCVCFNLLGPVGSNLFRRSCRDTSQAVWPRPFFFAALE